MYPESPLGIVCLLGFLFGAMIVSALLLQHHLEKAFARERLFVVFGSSFLYVDNPGFFLGSWGMSVMEGPQRVVLIDRDSIHFLKENEMRRFLTDEELKITSAHLYAGDTICVVR